MCIYHLHIFFTQPNTSRACLNLESESQAGSVVLAVGSDAADVLRDEVTVTELLLSGQEFRAFREGIFPTPLTR